MNRKKRSIQLDIEIPNRQGESFLRKSRKGRLAAESLGLTCPVRRNISNGAGFTLIELLVVIAIIASLIAILLTSSAFAVLCKAKQRLNQNSKNIKKLIDFSQCRQRLL